VSRFFTSPPVGETEIIWVADIHRFRFVRESGVFSAFRTRPIRAFAGHAVLGYSNVELQTPEHPRRFKRRVWWRRDNEDEIYGTKGAPAEAVDPLSVRAGQRSERPR
jgi:hypothetical protein